MSLQFIGDAGVYFPERDAVKINAIAGDALVEVFVTRSGLTALGCSPSDTTREILQRFEERRLECELAALVKYRRATTRLVAVEIGASDIAAAVERPHAA